MSKVVDLLGDKTSYYLDHTCKTIDKSLIYIPSPDTIDKVWIDSDRNIKVLNSLQTLLGHGRLANTGYVSILPVDQDIEHTAGASFAPNPIYFDPENIVKLAIEGGCNAVASTFGILGSVARKYAHKIPFVVKLNHNELLTYPNTYDQVLFGTVKEAWNMGAVAVGATIYFGSEQSRRQLVEIAEAFEYAHELGMATILWCYLRNSDFKKGAIDYHAAADLTGQADRLGVTIKADIVKEKRTPYLSTITGGLSGPCIRPIAVRMVWQVAHAVKIPVIGLGGIMNGRDALEFILAGATAVEVGTANFVDPNVTEKIIDYIDDYCHRHNISSMRELIGGMTV